MNPRRGLCRKDDRVRKFRIYLANGETLTIRAKRFETSASGAEVTFYGDDDQPLPDVLIVRHQVAAVVPSKDATNGVAPGKGQKRKEPKDKPEGA